MSAPVRPRLAVSAGVWRSGEVLLIQRGKPPLAGLWTFPGGHVEPGETVAAAVHRELAEETGLAVVLAGEPLVHEIILREASGALIGHHVLLVHAGRVAGDRAPVAASDAAAARFVTPADALALPVTEGLHRFIAETARRAGVALPP